MEETGVPGENHRPVASYFVFGRVANYSDINFDYSIFKFEKFEVTCSIYSRNTNRYVKELVICGVFSRYPR
jgi:hypothetical protein